MVRASELKLVCVFGFLHAPPPTATMNLHVVKKATKACTQTNNISIQSYLCAIPYQYLQPNYKTCDVIFRIEMIWNALDKQFKKPKRPNVNAPSPAYLRTGTFAAAVGPGQSEPKGTGEAIGSTGPWAQSALFLSWKSGAGCADHTLSRSKKSYIR